jgi:phage-related protein
MTKTRIIIYQDLRGNVLLLDWLGGLPKRDRAKCVEKIERLANYGHMLRRPDCDYLADGVYELRARAGNVNYRMLYAFVGKQIILLSHGCTKEDKLDRKEIDRAIINLASYRQNPDRHAYKGAY